MELERSPQPLNNELGKMLEAKTDLVGFADLLRVEACRKLSDAHRSEFGQFLTPPTIAKLMASMFGAFPKRVRLLDAGAGVGALTCAFVDSALGAEKRPESIEVVFAEVDATLCGHLIQIASELGAVCQKKGVKFSYEIESQDFLRVAVMVVTGGGLFQQKLKGSFTHAILNPPYKKLNSDSAARKTLREAGIETSNFYTAFVWLACELLAPNGEVVCITPRSFCNGPYFLPFRKFFFGEMALNRIHLFEKRDEAFKDDEVLQENVIMHAFRSHRKPNEVTLTTSSGTPDDDVSSRQVPYSEIINEKDKNLFVHLAENNLGVALKDQVENLPSTLDELGLTISTGRVVDFRATEWIRETNGTGVAPLIYPNHLVQGFVQFPGAKRKKPDYILDSKDTASLLVPKGFYVLTKRFTSKEEKKRVVASLYDPKRDTSKSTNVGFENHLNYFHADGNPLPEPIAKGLLLFLNSTIIDEYFRQFNGHTQVNATDLRKLKYPSKSYLTKLGQSLGTILPDQNQIDKLVQDKLGFSSEAAEHGNAKKKIAEVLEILQALNVPKGQRNERSALALLSLLDLAPSKSWTKAKAVRLGITEMMDFFRANYGKNYAPNSRESVRRRTVHQFVQLGILVKNPDDPNRPINSELNCYQVEAQALSLFHSYGTPKWQENLKNYLANSQTIRNLSAKEREMTLIPARLPSGETLQLSAGGQNNLIKRILEEFCPRFVPGGIILYVGDAGQKFIVNEVAKLAELGLVIDQHGKMPDVVVYHEEKNWLVLIEAVTSHGPMNLKRKNELRDLFRKSAAPQVFVTAFPTKREMVRFLPEISWETEVWLADTPSHLVHFNGERFLGPYEN